jgi:1,4-dihydroxy-2-naphthoate octaprenyltransferase
VTKDIFGPMRVPFLVLAPACALLGVGTAYRSAGSVSLFHVILAFIGAISAHICVNTFNEYVDFKSGLDGRTERTPFSGGSGVLPLKPELARPVLFIAVASLILTALIGVYFVFEQGIALLPLGILGLFLLVGYTPWLTRQPVLCLIAPGLGFGTLMVMGTHFVLTGQYSWDAFLVNNLLLLNQFPDMEADKSVGRNHVLVVLGRRRSSRIYVLFLALAYMSVVAGVYWSSLPAWSLIGLATIVIGVPLSLGALRYAESPTKLVPYLGLNVIVNLATPVLVSLGLFIGS